MSIFHQFDKIIVIGQKLIRKKIDSIKRLVFILISSNLLKLIIEKSCLDLTQAKNGKNAVFKGIGVIRLYFLSRKCYMSYECNHRLNQLVKGKNHKGKGK